MGLFSPNFYVMYFNTSCKVFLGVFMKKIFFSVRKSKFFWIGFLQNSYFQLFFKENALFKLFYLQKAIFGGKPLRKNFDFLTEKKSFFHENTQKHFAWIVKIRDIKSLVTKDPKITQISQNATGHICAKDSVGVQMILPCTSVGLKFWIL